MIQNLVAGAALTLGAALAAAAIASAPAQAQGRGPVIPFESDRAGARGEPALRLLDDASRIPGHRITGLPVVDGKIGEYAELDGALRIYFPYGRIERAEHSFSKYKIDVAGRVEAHPDFRRVAGFDKALGPVCASRELAGGERLEMRLQDRAITLVQRRKDEINAALAPDNETYRVVTAADMRFMRGEPEAGTLYQACTKHRTTTAAKPAAPTAKKAN